MSLSALLERVEACQGPDRALDEAISRALCADHYFVQLADAPEGAEFQAFTWCRDEASGIARAWREGREFGHNVTAVWAEAV
jgi:hypothetical protein